MPSSRKCGRCTNQVPINLKDCPECGFSVASLNPFAYVRVIVSTSKPLYRGSFVVSTIILLWIVYGFFAPSMMGGPVWMYVGDVTTITHFFPFLIRYSMDRKRPDRTHYEIVTDVSFPLDQISLTTYVLALAFLFMLAQLWLPMISPQDKKLLGSTKNLDYVLGGLSAILFVLLLLSVLEDATMFSLSTNFNEIEHYAATWEEYKEDAGIQGDSSYQRYFAANMLFFVLTIAIFIASISGMVLSSRQHLARHNENPRWMTNGTPHENPLRGLKNISLVLAILYTMSVVIFFLALLPFANNGSLLPAVPMFILLLLMSRASFLDWTKFPEGEFSFATIVTIFIVLQIAFIITSFFFGQMFLAAE